MGDGKTPEYYRLYVRGVDIDVFDVAEAAGLTPAAGMALKYLIRAGKKGDALDDLKKAVRCIEREIELRSEGRVSTAKRAVAPVGIATLCKVHRSDAGLDVAANEDVTIPAGESRLVKTGVRLEIPEGFVGLLWSRSGLAAKFGIECGAGCIDASYRGEVHVLLHNHSKSDFTVSKGDRIAQLLTVPVDLGFYEKVAELSETARGSDGFGSSDEKPEKSHFETRSNMFA
jgi:dUTP pyrophosphatase